MRVDLQFQIKNNPYYLRYLRENSIWYKRLNRNPALFKQFEEEARDRFKLNFSHRISKTLDTLEFITSIVSTLKP